MFHHWNLHFIIRIILKYCYVIGISFCDIVTRNPLHVLTRIPLFPELHYQNSVKLPEYCYFALCYQNSITLLEFQCVTLLKLCYIKRIALYYHNFIMLCSCITLYQHYFMTWCKQNFLCSRNSFMLCISITVT